MRTAALSMMLIYGLASGVVIAEDQPQSTPAAGSSHFDRLKNPALTRNFKVPNQFTALKPSRITPEDGESRSCFVMDTYVMKRDDPDSDSTVPAGHTTCLPSSIYSMKNATVVVGTPTP